MKRQRDDIKKPTLAVVVFYGLFAVIWTFTTIMAIVYKTYTDSIFWFVLTTLATLLFIIDFVVYLKRYRSK